MPNHVVVYNVDWPGGSLRVHSFPSQLHEEGAAVTLQIPAERAVLLSPDLF